MNIFTIDCTIERLQGASETAWILSIPAASVANVIVQFAALHIEKTKRIRFTDRLNGYSMIIERMDTRPCLRLDNKAFPITEIWLDAVASLLTDAALYGWNNAAHIDAEFENSEEAIAVCISIDPPV